MNASLSMIDSATGTAQRARRPQSLQLTDLAVAIYQTAYEQFKEGKYRSEEAPSK